MQNLISELGEVSDPDKKSIIDHPLFPAMSLLFEKCEVATHEGTYDSSDLLMNEIQRWLPNQAFSVDDDIGQLLLNAAQVLRIHLLELEKVNDLCEDFCTRYITSLRSKLHSENLLRGIPAFEELQHSDHPTQPTSSASSTTVYQMLHTPQGLVAQPITVTQPVSSLASVTVSDSGMTQQSLALDLTTTSILLDEDEKQAAKSNGKRGILPRQATEVMKSWLFQHIVHPYPTEEEKKLLALQTKLTLLQVNNWFINARRRILQPMMSDNDNKIKKIVVANKSTSAQRFWPENLVASKENVSNICVESPESNAKEDDGISRSPGELELTRGDSDEVSVNSIVENATAELSGTKSLSPEVQTERKSVASQDNHRQIADNNLHILSQSAVENCRPISTSASLLSSNAKSTTLEKCRKTAPSTLLKIPSAPPQIWTIHDSPGASSVSS